MNAVTQVRVLYADTDQMGVVNNVHYLRYFEQGRAEWIRRRGKTYKDIEHEGAMLPVAEAFVKYREPARYDDLLDIAVHAEDVRAASVVFRYEITRASDGALLCEGYTKHACVDRAGRVQRFPAELLRLLNTDL